MQCVSECIDTNGVTPIEIRGIALEPSLIKKTHRGSENSSYSWEQIHEIDLRNRYFINGIPMDYF